MIDRCEQERSGLKTLCSYHVAKHRRDASDEPVEAWALRQTPFLRAHQFSLIPFQPVMRWEMLYALQQRDARGGKIDPTLVRMLAGLLGDRPRLLGADRSELMALAHTKTCTGASAHINEIYRAVHVGHEEMCGIKPTDKLVWHLPSIKAPSRKSKTGRARSTHGELGFTAITQPWLRGLTLEWARHIDPSLEVLRDTFRVSVLVSGALNQRPGGAMDPARLTAADMDAAVDAIRSARRKDGELFTRNSARSMAHKLFSLLDFGRRTGLMADAPTAFARHHRRHSIGHDDEDENGKAIPEPVIAQLDTHLETLGVGIPYGHLTDDEVRHMLRTAYVLLRDTGRRPREICSLRSNCLEHSGDDYELIWDNYKSKRHRRRLPITRETAQAVQEWLPVRSRLRTPPVSEGHLFPTITGDHIDPYLTPGYPSRYLRRWVDAIPKLDSNTTGPDGSPLPFDRTLIYPYAFRHSYAQRHADAGVPIDVLRELMDHRQISTTMGYYKVSLKRKRAAVSTMRLHVIDRAGNPAPMSSNTGYEARSVAVPFGNCIEPSNVKAGGSACPIRFQCSGCGFYRPDPSYLPAIEEHINSLRADREIARAMDVDSFVIRNLTEQIAAFQQVIATMQNELASLPDDERSEIEEASAVLRKARATHGRTTLPLTVVNRRPA